MELETDAFQIIIEEESNRTGKKKKLLRDDPFSLTTMVDRKKNPELTNKQSMTRSGKGESRRRREKERKYLFLFSQQSCLRRSTGYYSIKNKIIPRGEDRENRRLEKVLFFSSGDYLKFSLKVSHFFDKDEMQSRNSSR